MTNFNSQQMKKISRNARKDYIEINYTLFEIAESIWMSRGMIDGEKSRLKARQGREYMRRRRMVSSRGEVGGNQEFVCSAAQRKCTLDTERRKGESVVFSRSA